MKTSPDLYPADQTNFSAQEPLYESASIPQKPVDPSEQAALPKVKKFYNAPVFRIGAGIAVLVATVILIIVAMMFTSNGNEQVVAPSAAPTSQPVSNDPLEQRIQALSQQLLEADPSDDSLPLPPVDLTLSLEE